MFQKPFPTTFSFLFKNVYRIHFCGYSNKNSKMRVLNVAEKNDAAKNIAGHLSGGNMNRVIILLFIHVISKTLSLLYF